MPNKTTKTTKPERQKIISSRNQTAYSYVTTTTEHQECMDAIKHKCNWEQMPRMSVLLDWPSLVCEDCAKIMDIREDAEATKAFFAEA